MEFLVKEEEGLRLDLFLVRQVPGIGREAVRRLIRDGLVRVNGRICAKGSAIRAGDRVTVTQLPDNHAVIATPDPTLKLHVWFQDAFLVVVEKPAKMASHPLRRDEQGTVASALVARFPEMANVGYHPREPGLIHRLDNDTSGLLMAARNQETFLKLQKALKAHKVDKRYLALCSGRVQAPHRIETKLLSNRRDRRRVQVAESGSAKGRLAVTEILKSSPKADFSLVELRVFSAARHQIRAHLAWLGHPLAGDSLYRGPELVDLNRHFLHASELYFTHPETGRAVHLSSPLPPELSRIIERL
jgi:23S rRNA pseudouridine1911/1915/1917 synthase